MKNAVNKCIGGLIEKKDSVLTCGNAKDLPSKDKVEEIISTVRGVIFPCYFADGLSDKEAIENKLIWLFDALRLQIKLAFGYEREMLNSTPDEACDDERAETITAEFISKLPEVFETISLDIKATLAGDPAAHDLDEIILTYPGIEAVFVYRLAHILYESKVPFIPRMMTEYAHSKTCIDINPGAKIGKSFVLDHGTGVVIGETTELGEHVSIYQGVTLGAISLKDARDLVGKKRHPTICDNVTIYAGASILGGETVIGEGAVIGSSVFLTSSVAAGVTVAMDKPKLKVTKK